MSSTPTAEIIPFPLRRPQLSDLPPVEPTGLTGTDATTGDGSADAVEDPETSVAQARLVRALASLDAALAEQRTAVAAWRGALSDLRTTMQGLSHSVQTYRGALESLDGKVGRLRGEATRLERWADDALTLAGDPAAAG